MSVVNRLAASFLYNHLCNVLFHLLHDAGSSDRVPLLHGIVKLAFWCVGLHSCLLIGN